MRPFAALAIDESHHNSRRKARNDSSLSPTLSSRPLPLCDTCASVRGAPIEDSHTSADCDEPDHAANACNCRNNRFLLISSAYLPSSSVKRPSPF
ncbi:hypothetical protein HPP92_021983 [Vanilla planifolia]|uniref:Uncharacterized protein n=1 Tax=Vanilla planifolia TaxID=51239 RepID=A0A835PRD8_VANPL|nr:hypothetical protein HPP92_022295 [Vanilla planifolia]KAG0458855.1 hypothetical protein HPP92_021983 [Vanilla planifolia]